MSEVNEEKKEKCFIIMPISDQGDYPAGHFTKVYEQIIKPSVEEVGYEAYRVDENTICDTIMNKIFSAIQECSMAVCDLSGRNPNVLYELGLRQAYDKPVVLIQDDKTEKIFDVSGISTVFYKSARLYEDVIEARENIKKAILSTREGKTNTLAKVMKVNAADFSNTEVSQDDKTNIMLEGIYNEIRGLKNRERENYLNSITVRSGSNNNINVLNESSNLIKISIIVKYKDYETIKRCIDFINCNIDGLIQFDGEKLSRDKYIFYFVFDDYGTSEVKMSKIKEAVRRFGMKIIMG
jgi:hypothetical protein